MHAGKSVRAVSGQRQEPDDGRLSRPVPWERRGKVLLRDPITPNSFNANVMNPVLKEIEFISKVSADIKLKITNHDQQWGIRKNNAPP